MKSFIITAIVGTLLGVAGLSVIGTWEAWVIILLTALNGTKSN